MHDIIDTAVAAGSFKTLAAAVAAADLVSTLKGKGPFTVFAPTDEAFAKLPTGVALNGKSAKTVNGADVQITTTGGVKLNGAAAVVKTDIECTNGVIHVLDAVILPPG
jgi:uncharacterized surface protein with fasciclin (FAS1) repeats